MLILVDEISTSGDEAAQVKVISEIGIVLNADGRTNIIVSALSPIYIHKLVSRVSNRAIQPVYISPLLDFRLGFNETKTMLDNCGAIKHAKSILTQRLLTRLPLFLSGRPRSIKNLVVEMNNGEFSFTQKEVSRCSLSSFAQKLYDADKGGTIANDEIKPVFDMAYSNEEYVIGTSSVLMSYFDSGNIVAVPGKSKRYFRVMIPFLKFISAIETASTTLSIYKSLDTSGKCTVDLLGPLLGKMDVSTVWETCIFLSVISHGRTNKKFDDIFGTAFSGVFANERGISSGLTYNTANDENERVKQVNTLLVASKGQAGYDGLAWVKSLNDDLFIYLRVKIQIDANKTLQSVITASILNIVNADLANPLDRIVIIFYLWEELSKPSQADILKELKLSASTPGYGRAFDYVTSFYDDNLYIVERSTMEDWLPPTLWPIPRMYREEDP
jgi:hypothetical protein